MSERRLFVLLMSVIVLFVVFVELVHRFGWGWTGFAGEYSQVTVKEATKDTVYLMPKTLWDWMQLLLVPVMLAIGGFWLNQRQKNRDERIAEQQNKAEQEATERRAQADREIAADNQREAALQSYIDKIGELLLREHEHLGASPGNSQVENIARARTVTVLRILDPGRRASLLRFLNQAGILRICTEGNLTNIDLHETNLGQVDLSQFDLLDANLSGADLRKANLSGAHLSMTWLHKADLAGADLRKAHLSEGYLFEAYLNEADLSGADLRWAHLNGAHLDKVNLSKLNLSGADLRKAHLSEADLSGADLRGANLSEANLYNAILSGADLRGAKGLTNEQRMDYQSRGALVDLIPSTSPSRSAVLPLASSTPQRDREKGQSLPFVQVAETPSSTGDTMLPMQEENDTDANSSSVAPPTQPDFTS